MSYQPVSKTSEHSDNSDAAQSNIKKPTPINNWHGGSRTLGRGKFEALAGWIWDVLLTLVPICFFVLAIAANRLEGEPVSRYGNQVVDLTRLSPTIYPILFAAVISRFFRNISRWGLERRGGIRLGALEQTFGSQSLAGSIERLLFVRSNLLFGILIVLVWGLSPLGGQSAVRLLHTGEGIKEKRGPIYYADSRLQYSLNAKQFMDDSLTPQVSFNGPKWYMASLVASPAMKADPVDLWGLPKIPQWPRELGDGVERRLDQLDNEAFIPENEFYTSWLGVHVQGLNLVQGKAQYDFAVKKTYYDTNCTSAKTGLRVAEYSKHIADPEFNLTTEKEGDGTVYMTPMFAVSMTLPNMTQKFPDNWKNPIPLNDVPPARMQYITRESPRNLTCFALFDCDVRKIVVDTDIMCNTSSRSTDCWATRQKRSNDRFHSDEFPSDFTSDGKWGEWDHHFREGFFKKWSAAEQASRPTGVSLTDLYLAGDNRSFDEFGESKESWTDVPLDLFSRRLTTMFNTYLDSAMNNGHNKPSFQRKPDQYEMAWEKGSTQDANPAFSQTEGTATVRYQVYRANRLWVSLLITTTACLEVLAVLGVVLQLFIRGPDILGFASSLTRENPFVDVLPGGTTIDGSERARLLGHLKVQLSDIRPDEGAGYIALRGVRSVDKLGQEDEGSWKPLNSKRHYC
ncbi:hypothetical protein FSARC_11835 [Fusarium sarcochroum]|uniref:Uncharacterized protein n=1 Tax=Fusarium sarcochroum TaxID=1208366 RepID=A0A8H4TCN6_9HYPO|nr:hypothetical protein FSARC_11835 [Fusarium sarcochroum]